MGTIGEMGIIFKIFSKIFKSFVTILFLLITLFLFGIPVIVGIYLFPSLLIIQGVYLSTFAFRKKNKELLIMMIILTFLLICIFIGFGIWANPTFSYSLDIFRN